MKTLESLIIIFVLQRKRITIVGLSVGPSNNTLQYTDIHVLKQWGLIEGWIRSIFKRTNFE